MTDDELYQFAIRLEEAVDRDKAESRLSGGALLLLTGTRDALMHLAAACLRAAAASLPVDDSRGKPWMLEHRQIDDSKSDYILAGVQRIDGFPENPDAIAKRKRDAWRGDRGYLLGCGVVGSIVFFVLTSGLKLWWDILTGKHP